MKKKINGFTLAEVLVTLMIIGVIASMTIPGLKNSAEERERVAQLKKAYSTVANATSMLETEYGPIKYWNWNDTATIMDEMYVKQFNVAKNCKMNGKCYDPSYRPKYLDGSLSNDFENNVDWYTFVTNDGAYWAASGFNAACSYNQGQFIKNGCMYIEVDLNGVRQPNTFGVDLFGFSITKEGAFPFGGCPGCTDDECKPKAGTGSFACTAKLLKTGKYTW